MLDACGALVSTLALGLVLPLFASELGTTRPALHLLAAFPLVYGLFDLACIRARTSSRSALFVIATANGLYPVFSIAILARDAAELTAFGLVYFGLETAVVWGLAALEFALVARPSPR
jgi:hypothetical protein